MVNFAFTNHGKKAFQRLPKTVQQRLMNKLIELKDHPDIFSVLKRLHQLEPATHRLRIGEYRLILQLEISNQDDSEFLILDIGHRREIYR